MVFTKRERMVGILAGLGIGLFVLNSYAISPFLVFRAGLKTDTAKQKAKIAENRRLVGNQPRVADEWRKLLLTGLRANPSDAESQLLDSLQRWQPETNLRITAFHQDRAVTARDKQFEEVPFHATGTGRMADTAAMLWVLETAPMPLRVNSIQIAPVSGREATDNLTVQINLTTLCINPNPEPDKPAPKPAAKEQ